MLWRVPSVDGVDAFKASFARFAYARHSHDAYAFGDIDAGAMAFWHGGSTHTAPAGDVITLNPGDVHDGRSASPTGCRYRMLYVERPVVEQALGSEVSRIGRYFALRGPVISDRQLAGSIRSFHASLGTDPADRAAVLEQQSRMLRLLVLLFARHGEPRIALGEAFIERRPVKRAIDYMAANLDRQLRLVDLAAAAGLSPFYFQRTFRRTTGLPPHAYLNQMRLDRVRALLQKGEPPAEIAAELGFVDQSHLSRRFKSAFGVTPGQYARAHRR